MNTYPGFYRAVDGKEYLYLDKSNYFSFERGIWGKSDPSDNHKKDTNITREYLANTYGKVESKDHADFIAELAGKHGFDTTAKFTGSCKYFYISERELSFYMYKDSSPIATCKEITIPIPPKEPEPKEWPKVGDEVLTASKQKASVVAIDSNQVWIKYKDTSIGCGYATVAIATLSKPLTPEEELATSISNWRGQDKATIGDSKLAEAIINSEIKGLSYKPE